MALLSNFPKSDLEPAPLYAEDKNSKVYLDAEFPVPVDTLFSLVWLPSSPFWSAFMNIRKTRQWTCDEWSNESSGKITRECRCIQHIQLPMGSTKDVPQVDEHTLVLSENSKRIVVDARTYIRDVSWTEYFAIARLNSYGTCTLSVAIMFHKIPSSTRPLLTFHLLN